MLDSWLADKPVIPGSKSIAATWAAPPGRRHLDCCRPGPPSAQASTIRARRVGDPGTTRRGPSSVTWSVTAPPRQHFRRQAAREGMARYPMQLHREAAGLHCDSGLIRRDAGVGNLTAMASAR